MKDIMLEVADNVKKEDILLGVKIMELIANTRDESKKEKTELKYGVSKDEVKRAVKTAMESKKDLNLTEFDLTPIELVQFKSKSFIDYMNDRTLELQKNAESNREQDFMNEIFKTINGIKFDESVATEYKYQVDSDEVKKAMEAVKDAAKQKLELLRKLGFIVGIDLILEEGNLRLKEHDYER